MKLRKDKWKEIRLEQLCEFVRGPFGGSLKKEIFVDDGYAIYEQQHAINNQFESFRYYIDETKYNEMKRFQVSAGDIIMSCSGTFGKIAIIPANSKPGIINQALLKLRCKRDLYNIFFSIWLNSPSFQEKINSSVQGTAIKNIASVSFYKQIETPLPPLEEQKQIASLFQAIETAIEQVAGQEKNLLALKNKLLMDLFSEKQDFGNQLKADDFEMVRFDKVAINISERVEPKKTDLTTYVGLEHLDADNLKIERTGIPDDVIGTKLKIYKGDIIFGKRRAYLRKVAVSHFDGIASAHSMILRANEKHIEKEFLPFFMQSDVFMTRAVQISEGSLSPTIKWKTLAAQEFSLPKKEKQRELTVLFKQFDLTREQLKQQKTTLKNLKQKLLSEILG